jgi:hypothetical protein
MAAAFTLRCSEKDTLLDAAGKTIAVDKNNGVIKKAMMIEMIAEALVNTTNDFR